jgi:hypothetical protein
MAYPFHDKNGQTFPLFFLFPVLLEIFHFQFSNFQFSFLIIAHVYFVDPLFTPRSLVWTFVALVSHASHAGAKRRINPWQRVPATFPPCGKGTPRRQATVNS